MDGLARSQGSCSDGQGTCSAVNDYAFVFFVSFKTERKNSIRKAYLMGLSARQRHVRDADDREGKSRTHLMFQWCLWKHLQTGRKKAFNICHLLLLFQKKVNISHHGQSGKLGPGSPFGRQGPGQCSGARGTMVLGAEEKSGEKEKGKQVLAWPWWQGS